MKETLVNILGYFTLVLWVVMLILYIKEKLK